MFDFHNYLTATFAGDPGQFTRFALFTCDHLIPFGTANPPTRCPQGHSGAGDHVSSWDLFACQGCGFGLLHLGWRPKPCSGSGRHRPEAKWAVVHCDDCGKDLLFRPGDDAPAVCRGSGVHPGVVPAEAVSA